MELFAAMESMGKANNMDRHDDRSSRNSNSSGSGSEKLRMLDITRDKPIKVAVRVAVPVRDHPKFNFVGKLLGPKGNSMKRLQEDTMCKMAVLGRGSMKDRKKEDELRMSGDPRYSHLLEDLHVEISTFAAPAEAHARIAYALAEVRRFLVPDYHDDIRQEQMWEMQALTSTTTTSTSTSQGQSLEVSNPSTNSSSTADLLGGSCSNNCNSSCSILNTITAAAAVAASAATNNSNHNGNGNNMSPSNSLDDHHHHPHQSHHNNHHHHHHNHLNNNGHNCDNASSASSTSSSCSSGSASASTASNGVSSDLMQVDASGVAQGNVMLQASTANGNHNCPTSGGGGILSGGILGGAAAVINGMLPAAGVAAMTTNHANSNNNSILSMAAPNEADAQTVLVDNSTGLIHPALRGVKTVSIAGGMARKRPLLGVPRSTMNPTKRTVMTLLARAKNAQQLHSARSGVTALGEPIQMITSPLILQQPLDVIQHNGNGAAAMQKENILQGA